MKGKRMEITTLLLAAFKKTEISKLLNVDRLTIHLVKQSLKASELSSIRKISGY